MKIRRLKEHSNGLVSFIDNLISTRGEYVLGETLEEYLEVFNPDFNLEESSLWFVYFIGLEDLNLEFKVEGSVVYAFLKGNIEINLNYNGDLVGSRVEDIDFKIRVFNDFKDNPLEEAYLDTFTDNTERKRLTPKQQTELAKFLSNIIHTRKIFYPFSFYALAEHCYKKAKPVFRKGFKKPTFDPSFVWSTKYTGLEDLDVSFKTHKNSDYAVFEGLVSIEFRFYVKEKFFTYSYSNDASFRVKIRRNHKILMEIQEQIRGF